MARAIGIDLGTTYTVVATIEGGRPRFIPNAEGQRLTPSVVAFPPEGKPLVGQAAKAQAAANPERTIFSIKRRMGSDYRLRIDERGYSPQEISGLILGKVKTDAEALLGERIEQAVITVPAYFNDRQRQATREAGALAGLEVLRILSEPTAAALAYGLEREEAHRVLVWDLGGGTFDVSILELGEGIFEVQAVAGDTWLGGDDYDARVMDYLMAEYRRRSGEEFPADPRARQRFWEAAEQAKRELSTQEMARVPLPAGLEVELRREEFESLTADLLERMVGPTHQALRDAALEPQDVDRVILVGGATRMPAVRRLARKLFSKEPYRYIDPDKVVAAGAAIQAGMLLGLVERAVLLDVLPLSLGVETQGGLMGRIIPRNTPLPAGEARIFTTAADGQTSMDIHILQGERALAVDNVRLGHLRLDGIPAAPRGVAKVEVAFQADMDGIVHVSARELLADGNARATIACTKLLDGDEIAAMAEAAEREAEQDSRTRQRVQAGIGAQNLIAGAEAALSKGQPGLPVEEIAASVSRLKDALAGGTAEELRRGSAELRELVQTSTDSTRKAGRAAR